MKIDEVAKMFGFRRLCRLLSATALVCAFALVSTASDAQVSRDMAEAAVDREVRIELNDGQSLEGVVRRVGEDNIVVRHSTGRLQEVDRQQVSAIFVQDSASPESGNVNAEQVQTAPPQTAPAPASSQQGEPSTAERVAEQVVRRKISEDEYLEAQQYVKRGKTLRIVGFSSMGAGGAAFIATLAMRSAIDRSYCGDFFDGEPMCKSGLHYASRATFITSAILVAGGVVLSNIGGSRVEHYQPIVRTFESQQASEESAESEPREATLSLSPMIGRRAGGAQIRVTF